MVGDTLADLLILIEEAEQIFVEECKGAKTAFNAEMFMINAKAQELNALDKSDISRRLIQSKAKTSESLERLKHRMAIEVLDT